MNPILYNLMSRKYRQAFKHTLCRCCLYRANRGRMRGERGQFLSERSQTYVTVAGTTRIISDKSAYFQKSPMVSRESSTPGDKGSGCLRNGLGLFKSDKSGAQGRVANGTTCKEKTRSRSNSPGVTVLAGHLGDDMELTGVSTNLRDDRVNSSAPSVEVGTLL